MNPDNKQPDDNQASEANKVFTPGKPHTSHNEQLRKARQRKRFWFRTISLLIIVVAAGLGSLYFSNQQQASDVAKQPVLVDAQPVQATVSLTAAGFTPATLALPKDSTVTWTNQAEQNLSVQSDNIRGFVEPLELGQKDTLTHTFSNLGEHVITIPETKQTMLVIVE